MKTILKVSSLIATGMLAASSFAAAPAHNAMSAKKPNMSQVSYMIGYQIGQGLHKQNLGVNRQDFLKGFNAGVVGHQSTYSKAQTESTMKQFQMYMMGKMAKKQEAKADSNARASAAFITKMSHQNGVKKLADGVYYRVLKAGNGPKPSKTDTVKVNYVGTLANGKVFDSSYKRKKPLVIGVNQVIPGWTKALENMPVGSTWMLYLSPKEAYGKFAPPTIGPNQALVFKVNLISIEKDHKKS